MDKYITKKSSYEKPKKTKPLPAKQKSKKIPGTEPGKDNPINPKEDEMKEF